MAPTCFSGLCGTSYHRGQQEDETGLSTTNGDTKVEVLKRQDSRLPAAQAVTFSWANLSVQVAAPSRRCCGALPPRDTGPPKEILKDAYGVVRPGEFLAILGASGAGKSTLLNTLLFRNLAGLEVSGQRMANGQKVTPSSLTAVSAYVQQDDLFFGNLTVREHLTFQALVRMDSEVPRHQRMDRVEAVIQELGLTKCSDTQIGVPGRFKGISGGQMKRLAFASEVLTNPALLFCDEPTSGLDSVMAASVVEVLRSLASQGRTIVCTIHQPSSQIVNLFDKVLLMAEGKTAYLGDVPGANSFFERCGFPCPPNYNPADHWLQVLSLTPGKEEAGHQQLLSICHQFQSSEQGVELARMAQEATNGSGATVTVRSSTSPYKASWGGQFSALLWRSWLSMIKDPLVLKIRIGTIVFIALVLGFVYFGQELYGEANAKQEGIMNINGAMFLFITNMTFSNMFSVINVFCMELPIFLREHFNGMYRTDTYFLAKQIAELPVVLLAPAIFLGIMYYMVGLNAEFVKFAMALAIIELMVQVVISFGYMISCLANSLEMALGLGPPLLIPLMLFGGLFLNNGSIPVYLVWIKYVSWFYFANEALSINQWDGIEGVMADCPPGVQPPANQTQCDITGGDILSKLNFEKDNFSFDLMMLAVLAVSFRFLAYLALLSKTYRKK